MDPDTKFSLRMRSLQWPMTDGSGYRKRATHDRLWAFGVEPKQDTTRGLEQPAFLAFFASL